MADDVNEWVEQIDKPVLESTDASVERAGKASSRRSRG